MARVTHTAVTAPGGYPSLQPSAGSLALNAVAADSTNKEQVLLTGREIIIARNSSGSTARTVTITSAAAGSNRRTGDITAYSLPLGTTAVFGPFPLDGWRQSDGYLYFEASHADVIFSVITIP